jgi:hypothetical protein
MSFVIAALERHHTKDSFGCGEPALNNFLQKLARQQAEKDFNRTYVAFNLEKAVDRSQPFRRPHEG